MIVDLRLADGQHRELHMGRRQWDSIVQALTAGAQSFVISEDDGRSQWYFIAHIVTIDVYLDSPEVEARQ